MSSSPYAHPLDPLTPEEIRSTAQAVRDYVATGDHAGKPIQKIQFNVVSLREPGKLAILSWAKLFPEEQLADVGGKREPLKRQADVSLVFPAYQ